MTLRITIKRSEQGYRCGDSHHNAKLPDAVVVQARDLYEFDHMMPAEIARKLGVPYCTVRGWVYYRKRNVTPREREG
jgi:hypothetical protein